MNNIFMALEKLFRDFMIQLIDEHTKPFIEGDSSPIKKGMKKFNVRTPSEWYSGHFVGTVETVCNLEFRRVYRRGMNPDEETEFVNLIENATRKIREHFSKYDLK